VKGHRRWLGKISERAALAGANGRNGLARLRLTGGSPSQRGPCRGLLSFCVPPSTLARANSFFHAHWARKKEDCSRNKGVRGARIARSHYGWIMEAILLLWHWQQAAWGGRPSAFIMRAFMR